MAFSAYVLFSAVFMLYLLWGRDLLFDVFVNDNQKEDPACVGFRTTQSVSQCEQQEFWFMYSYQIFPSQIITESDSMVNLLCKERRKYIKKKPKPNKLGLLIMKFTPNGFASQECKSPPSPPPYAHPEQRAQLLRARLTFTLLERRKGLILWVSCKSDRSPRQRAAPKEVCWEALWFKEPCESLINLLRAELDFWLAYWEAIASIRLGKPQR